MRELFARFPGGVHVTERPYEEQGTYGHPSGKKNDVGRYNLAHSKPLPAARSDLTLEDAPNVSHGGL